MSKNAIILVKRVAGGIEYWDARWYDPAAGRRRAKSLGRCDRVSERQARKLLTRIEVKFEDDPFARSAEAPPTLGEWMDLFVQRQEAKGRKPSTLGDYRTVRKMLEAHFGAQRRINTISKLDLERLRVRMAKQEFNSSLSFRNKRRAGNSTVVKYMRNVSTIFTAAFDDDLILRNPARKLGLEPTPAASWRKVSAEDFWKVYDQAEGGLKTLLALCRLAGLRRSDALALRWSNIHLDDGVIVFRPIKVERFAKVDARVPICAELRKILEELRQTSLRIDGHVVAQGVPVNINDYLFPALCKKAGVEPWSKPLHTLRKSCIDDWARIAPANVTMEWATHTSLATTMKFYAKVNKADEQLGQQQLFRRAATTTVSAG